MTKPRGLHPPLDSGPIKRLRRLTGSDDVRAFQRERGLPVTGELDERTRLAVEATVREGLVPEWFCGDSEREELERRIGGWDEDAIRRFQSAAGLPVTGTLTKETAIRIGE